MRGPARQVRALPYTQAWHDHQSTIVLIRRCDDRPLDVARAGGQDFSSLKTVPSALDHQTQVLAVVRVPDAGKLAVPCFAGDQQNLLPTAVSEHEADRVDMAFEKPPEWQASRADFSQNLAQRQSADSGAAPLARQGCRQQTALVECGDIRGRVGAIVIVVGGARVCTGGDIARYRAQVTVPH